MKFFKFFIIHHENTKKPFKRHALMVMGLQLKYMMKKMKNHKKQLGIV